MSAYDWGCRGRGAAGYRDVVGGGCSRASGHRRPLVRPVSAGQGRGTWLLAALVTHQARTGRLRWACSRPTRFWALRSLLTLPRRGPCRVPVTRTLLCRLPLRSAGSRSPSCTCGVSPTAPPGEETQNPAHQLPRRPPGLSFPDVARTGVPPAATRQARSPLSAASVCAEGPASAACFSASSPGSSGSGALASSFRETTREKHKTEPKDVRSASRRVLWLE